MQTEKWHEWRAGGLGSSDAPVIMGVSPWSTPYQLWERKLGLVKKEFSNPAIDRGNALEPRARAAYEFEVGDDFPARLAEHALHPWVRASLDGYNARCERVLEIKCPGAADHATALDGRIPEKYYPQVQHQLLVTAARSAHYYSFDGDTGVIVEVLPDLDYQAKLFKALSDFWFCVTNRVPPPLTDRDRCNVRDDNVKELANIWLAAKTYAVMADDAVNTARQALIAALDARSGNQPLLAIGDVKATRVFARGHVDYGKIPELKSVDLEPYRKPGTSYWTFKVGVGE